MVETRRNGNFYLSLLFLLIFAKMFPDRASLHIASIEDEEYKNAKINFWDNVP